MAAKKKFYNPAQVTLTLEKELRQQFKLAATLENKESSELIREFMEEYKMKILKKHGIVRKGEK